MRYINLLFTYLLTYSCINSTTARRGGYVLERVFTKFSEITQCNGHYAI